jgi:hypothetical protein
MYIGHTLEKEDFLEFYKKNINKNDNSKFDIISL